MRRLVWIFTLLFALLILFPATAEAAASTPLEAFEYTRSDPGTVLLTKYIGDSTSVTVPDSYFLDGATCRVQLASETVFAGNDTLTSVTIPLGVTFQNNSMKLLFAKCVALRSVKLRVDTSEITDMSYIFYNCEALEFLDLSAFHTAKVTTMKAMFSGCKNLGGLTGYENWDTGSLKSIAYMFNQTKALKTVDISRWNLSGLENSAWCFQSCGAERVLLPENLAVISAGFFNHLIYYTGSSFTVPAGVKKIGYAHTLYDLGTDSLREILVAPGNTAYKAVDGILYSADGTEMLAIPRTKPFPDGTYTIPEGVTFLGELSFSKNSAIKKVILPDSYVLRYVPLYDPEYITFDDTGNLNTGLNLHIAIYAYTGVRYYGVKDSNPNYKGLDGVLYTKDGSTLVAVPIGYEGLLTVPEGVTVWQTGAMWGPGGLVDEQMKNCKGVSIPASLTQIAPDQLDKLNRLESLFSGFRISVSPENPVYYTGKSGQLLERSNMDSVEIALQQNTFTYDGTPKEPKPVVSLNGKPLREGEDYTLSYTGNVDAGTAWVRISGMGDYYGAVEASFNIEKSLPEYTVPEGLCAVYGQTLGEVPLPEGFNWISPETLVGNTGDNSFTVNYTSKNPSHLPVSDIVVVLHVSPKPVGSESIALVWWCPWTDRPVTPEVTVVDVSGEVPAAEYTVTYENNRDFGEAKVILQDVSGGNYTVEGTAVFYIVPGPFLCILVLTALWCMTTGVTLVWDKKGPLSVKPPKNR